MSTCNYLFVNMESKAVIGAGLGCDSGLPDFRGPEGFWNAYPPMKKLGLSFQSVCSPHWFEDDPNFAWGFWLHGYQLYSTTTPHDGFDIMKKWGETKLGKRGYFVFTSNIDGHFQKKGFPDDRIIECHGSIYWLQCCNLCTKDLWVSSMSLSGKEIDPETFRLIGDVPHCPKCGKIARPNVLMFDDEFGWIKSRQNQQFENLLKFKRGIDLYDKVAVVEIGAGLTVPVVRLQSEAWGNSTLIRVNLRDTQVPSFGNPISLTMKGLDALKLIDQEIDRITSKGKMN
eukprot:TRINITY_DN5110_c0_g1_i2.p1 TRINITY_DN5110_c0_g1~~TRINITY_DN5110_c0_g1_i2.p1  ORF type:complete len:285 (-),score=45.89 TRINITY_DN5110_c0_g1_i2:217-1071(-)